LLINETIMPGLVWCGLVFLNISIVVCFITKLECWIFTIHAIKFV